MSFHIGQEVECIDDSDFKQFLTRGGKYIVLSVGSHCGCHGEWISVNCKPANNMPGAQSYRAARFRPLQRRSTKTGMAILRKVADDASKRKNLITTV